ncbi:RecBCD enzyme subunit RecC [compost metagenome]
MSLEIYISNHIRSLSAAMIADMQRHKLGVFQPYGLITQTVGMNNWLVVNMAQQMGIAANLKFMKPADLLWEIYGMLGGQSYYKINRQNIDWLIYAVLGSTDFQRRFPRQAAYYIEEGTEQELKKWEFAARIADLFDQYQIYRNRLIERWNRYSWEELDADMQWQAYIWQTIKGRSREAFPDVTDIYHYVLEQLNDPHQQERIRETMPVLYLFGLSILTPFHLHVFYELSRVIDFRCYLVNPAPDHYWFEDEQEEQIFLKQFKGKNVAHLTVGNPLLTSWGKILQNTYRLLFQADEFINAVNELPGELPASQTLLQQIQHDIYHNKIDDIHFSKQQLYDQSITITAHYSIPREVEVLYNYLLDAIQQQTYEGITERDIVVMVSDINAYAPYIRAVMDNAPYKFSYSIIDESIAQGDSIISALMALLSVNELHITAELILELLESQYIRQRFGIYKMDYLRSMIEQVNIRFGLENDYKDPVDDTYLVSWKYGLQQLMYGACFDGPQWYTAGRLVYTADVADNIEDLHQLTALSHFIHALEDMIWQRKAPKSLSEWKDYIDEVILTFMLSEDEDKDEAYWELLTRFRQSEIIDTYLEDTKISYEVFSKRLLKALGSEQQQLNFINRGITFCSPLPFRSIPFKVIAMLGLNFDSFPRKEAYVDFDLMAQKPMLGDRNVRNNDKHLFLESLLSAEQALYLSYTGRSIKDNKPLPPSVLIDELLDYIQSGCREEGLSARDILVQQHPLHSFSKRYNQPDSGLIPNYTIHKPTAFPHVNVAAAQDANVPEAIWNLNALSRFLTRPLQHYYQKVLGVYFSEEAAHIDDHEYFSLDSLKRWTVRNALIEGQLKDDVPERIKALYYNGDLPLRNMAETFIAEQDQVIKPIHEQYRKLVGDTAVVSVQMVYTYKDITFEGSLELAGDTLVSYVLKAADKAWTGKIRTGLQYLLGVACGLVKDAYLVTQDKVLKAASLTPAEAKMRLNALLDFYQEYHHRMIMFHIDIYDAKTTIDNYLGKIEDAINREVCYDEYVQHAFEYIDREQQQALFSGFQDLIEQYILPVFEYGKTT